MRLGRLALLALLTALALSPGAGALDVEEDFQPPDAEVGTPYTFQFVATEGCVPYRFSLSSGNLPPGLRITTEGQLTGAPTLAGAFEFYVALDDSVDCMSPQSQGRFSMRVLPDLAVANTSLPRARPGEPYNVKIAVSNPEEGFKLTWLLRGFLPPGLTFADGTVSGTPTATGKWGFAVRVQEENRRWGEQQLELVVAEPLAATAPSLGTGEVGLRYARALAATGGLQPLTWAVAGGALPGGLALDAATGAIRGTPRAAGSFALNFSVTDAGGETATTPATLQIVPKLAVATKILPRATAGRDYRARLATTGGLRPVKWKLVRGKLPRGIELASKTGLLTGEPRAPGTNRVTFEATDRLGASAKRTLTLTVAA